MEFKQLAFVSLYLSIGCFAYNVKRQGWITMDDVCLTPNQNSGVCVPNEDCQSMVKFLKQKMALSEREQEIKNSYSCGNRNSQKVCCPDEIFDLDWLKPVHDCKTPDQSPGRCIPANSCQPIMDFTQNRNVASAAHTILQTYSCDGGAGTLVCCPSKPVIIGNRDADNDSHLQDHSSHENAKLLPTNCGQYSSDDKIIGGTVASLFEFPWAVALMYSVNNEIKFTCGGTLISNLYIITAAHCITPDLIGVRLGELNFTTTIDCETGSDGEDYCAPTPQDYTISSADITIHSQYNVKGSHNDIALIRLENKANTSIASVHPICLPLTIKEKQRRIEFYTVIGWGTTETESSSKALLKTEVRPQNTSKCGIESFIQTRKLCAGGENEKDACRGDSGGPLLSEYIEGPRVKTIQYGIVSRGSTFCGIENIPTTYTSIPAYVKWILDNLKP